MNVKETLAVRTEVIDGCHVWAGSQDKQGYGWIGIQGRTRKAHRIAYELAHGLPIGSLRSDQFVCHSCDNPPCINPDHLWLGDARANTDDMMAKGRSYNGDPWGWGSGNCHRGHDISQSSNVYIAPRGNRECRECRRMARRRYQQKAFRV